jgi:group I intron endonuclease
MGSIYQIQHKTTGKLYIGQTQDTKTKNDVPYKYGIAGRWSDHISSAFRGAKTPLANALREYGPDEFLVSCLEKDVDLELLDEREAHWIKELNSVVPNGYNVMRHSRCKHREETSIANHYIPTTTKVRLNTVNRKGQPYLVYVYLDQESEEPVRITFGQTADSNYTRALEEAREFVVPFAECGIDIFEENAEDSLRKYREKIEQFRSVEIQRIRIAPFNHLIALYIKTKEGTTRICFGGKTVTKEDAYATALAVNDEIMKTHESAVLQDDMSKSATGGCS